MEHIKITESYLWSAADIMAKLTERDGVRIWFKYKDIGQERHEIRLSSEEWDRFVAWVEWQRKNRAINKRAG